MRSGLVGFFVQVQARWRRGDGFFHFRDSRKPGCFLCCPRMTHLWIAGKSKTISANVPRQESLLWESIKWAKSNGSRYYDLCVLEPDRLPQIAQFKLSFSKLTIPYFLLIKRPAGFRMLSKLQRWTGKI